jgi:hypothetical protein
MIPFYRRLLECFLRKLVIRVLPISIFSPPPTPLSENYAETPGGGGWFIIEVIPNWVYAETPGGLQKYPYRA